MFTYINSNTHSSSLYLENDKTREYDVVGGPLILQISDQINIF